MKMSVVYYNGHGLSCPPLLQDCYSVAATSIVELRRTDGRTPNSTARPSSRL